jgi:hypothetical protein
MHRRMENEGVAWEGAEFCKKMSLGDGVLGGWIARWLGS